MFSLKLEKRRTRGELDASKHLTSLEQPAKSAREADAEIHTVDNKERLRGSRTSTIGAGV